MPGAAPSPPVSSSGMSAVLVEPDRLDRAQRAAAAGGLAALLITPGPDLRWLTGYDAKLLERLTALVVPAGGQPFAVVPALEVPAAEASSLGTLPVEIIGWGETEDPYAVVAARLGPLGGSVGLANRMWAEQVLRFRAALPSAEQVLASEVLADLRMRKSPLEVEGLRAAGAAIDRVHARMGEWLRVGRTERAVARDIATAILDEGHHRVDFVIVGSGPNGASPHHEVGDRVIAAGDPVVVDIGGTHEGGYCSDCTRMYVLGHPPAQFRDYVEVLYEAQVAAVEHVRPGVSAESVDTAARSLITAAGFGESFIHRTGHGIGVETHEEPYIVEGNATVLEPGMAFSVEPGIYLPGRHGARIEDIVVVTQDGVERLNTTDRRPVTLG